MTGRREVSTLPFSQAVTPPASAAGEVEAASAAAITGQALYKARMPDASRILSVESYTFNNNSVCFPRPLSVVLKGVDYVSLASPCLASITDQ